MKATAMSSMDKEYQAQDDLRTVLDAKKIMKDPKRMNAVRALAKKKQAEMQALTEK